MGRTGTAVETALAAALRRRHDPAALAGSPLTRLPGVRRRAGGYAATRDAAGLALRDLLQETAAALRAEVAPSGGAADGRAAGQEALEALLQGHSLAATARVLDVPSSSPAYADLVTLHALLVRRFLERAR